jgi:hypothetical protein
VVVLLLGTSMTLAAPPQSLRFAQVVSCIC